MESDAVRQQLARCAESLNDLTRARSEVERLRGLGGNEAQFAAALFDIELARRGDIDSRSNLTTYATALMTYWRDGSGDEIANRNPVLERLWISLAPMLVQFERKRFELSLALCWKLRGNTKELHVAIAALEPQGQRNVEFARCLYHLELARSGDELSRQEFSKRVRLLSDAYHDVQLANDLIGPDAGLRFLWGELKPYLDEFFESLEETAAKTQEPTRRVKNPLLAEAPAVEEQSRPPPPPPPSVPPVIPRRNSGELLMVDMEEIVELEQLPPPPPPFEAEPEIIIDAEDIGPTVEAVNFWRYMFASLQATAADSTRMRMLASETREDRKRLTTFLDGLPNHLEVPEARAFGALTRLMLAGETKEKTLFGQPNPRRQEALTAAFSLLSADGAAAARASVWFAADGPQTSDALTRGLELLIPFLAFCSRKELDPLSPSTVKQYFST